MAFLVRNQITPNDVQMEAKNRKRSPAPPSGFTNTVKLKKYCNRRTQRLGFQGAQGGESIWPWAWDQIREEELPTAEIQATGAASPVQHPLAISRPAVDDGTDMRAEQEASRELAVQKEGLRGRLGKTVLLERLEASLT